MPLNPVLSRAPICVVSLQDEDGKGDDEGQEQDQDGGEYISRNSRLMLMLEDELPNCHNQERVDEFAVRERSDLLVGWFVP